MFCQYINYTIPPKSGRMLLATKKIVAMFNYLGRKQTPLVTLLRAFFVLAVDWASLFCPSILFGFLFRSKVGAPFIL